ncbi:hypothetical protein ALP74_05228 [Pseudomonas coronafaciens pv. garcae]|uniref:Uncharacterized protein n=1 Tax=Pseudomonas coronafaciens pv. garcae TaxID=251653 RepID=A0AB37QKR8_9PSED|nr:hypothetical protein ALP74_05228 [Pseudomonas coronafaciens pv. garcae]
MKRGSRPRFMPTSQRQCADHPQRQTFISIQRDGELALLGQIAFHAFVDDVDHRARRDAWQVQRLDDGLGTEVEGGNLRALASWQLMNHDQQARVFDVRDQNLAAGGDIVSTTHSENLLELRGKRVRPFQLTDQAAIQRPWARHVTCRKLGFRVQIGQIIGAPVNPARVTILHQMVNLLGGQGQRADQVPARQGKHTGLHGVVHRQQQVDVLNLLNIGIGDRVQIANAQGGRDDARSGTRHPVGDELEVVRRMLAGQFLVHLFANMLAQDVAGECLALVMESIVGVQRPEMHQFQRQLIVVLQRMNQRRRVDAISMHLTQHQAQELSGAGQQRVLVGGPRDEVVGQVSAALPHGRDVIDGQVQFLKAEAPRFADRPGQQLVACDRQRMAFRPRRALGTPFNAEKTVGVQAQYAGTHDIDGVQRITDDHLLRCKAWVQPVQRRLAVLEIMQVNPAPRLAIDALHHVGRAPVCFLYTRLEEDDSLQLTDDVVLVAQLIDHVRHQIDRVTASRDVGQQRPVFFTDLDHMKQAWIILIRHLGEAEVCALASVRRDDVVDDHRIVRRSNARQAQQLCFGAQVRVDAEADAVEITIDTWRTFTALQSARELERPVVNTLNADFGQGMPQRFVAQRFKYRAAFTGDDRCRIGGEPHRSDSGRISGTRQRKWTLPEPALPRIGLGALSCGIEHRLLDQPVHVLLVRYRHSVLSSSRIGDLRRSLCGTP